MHGTIMALVQGTVLQYWDEATYGPRYTVYYGVIGGIIMTFIGSAYAIVKSVDAAIRSTSRGFYFLYAGSSTGADNMGYYEIAVLGEY